jgi:hypothetical protein
MNNEKILADHDHPAVQAKAIELVADRLTLHTKLESLFHFVRDEIQFGFPPKWDAVRASETLQYKLGYCNTKATLFLALCKAAGIPARIHTGLIDIRIMRGVLPIFSFPFLPKAGGHSWLEVEIDDMWKPLDSYINDKRFYDNALLRLHESGLTTAFSISEAKGASSCEFNFGEIGFVHMGAVVEDHGTWDDFAEYMASDKYIRITRLQALVYPMISQISNRNIERIRSGKR